MGSFSYDNKHRFDNMKISLSFNQNQCYTSPVALKLKLSADEDDVIPDRVISVEEHEFLVTEADYTLKLCWILLFNQLTMGILLLPSELDQKFLSLIDLFILAATLSDEEISRKVLYSSFDSCENRENK